MTTDQLVQLGIFLVGVLTIGLTLIAFFDSKAKAREETRIKNEEKLQATAHEQATRIENLKEARVDSLFAGMAAGMKQMQDHIREMTKEHQGVMSDLRQNRSEMQTDRQVTKIEIEAIKESLKELRTEVKSVVTQLPGNWQRVSGPKFPGG
jgi:Tfp pilus assembly protein PilO